ncbi:hypothetical protein H696_00593 [Fonticula alba]|uniref:Ras-GEF domain-containing protein n=1 Tax=Fonticula alba TaxID=691883 RepID=A0A058ZF86_FONAL|nr:hypothetical protein H696_00593 [Fonticula alba]KCV73045.1 hypothetical protein H696_00593 [Fonticula alba]|eukprot:XP_009492746.1 hypothetical protein H696_00593 [Fonticula alba]
MSSERRLQRASAEAGGPRLASPSSSMAAALPGSGGKQPAPAGDSDPIADPSIPRAFGHTAPDFLDLAATLLLQLHRDVDEDILQIAAQNLIARSQSAFKKQSHWLRRVSGQLNVGPHLSFKNLLESDFIHLETFLSDLTIFSSRTLDPDAIDAVRSAASRLIVASCLAVDVAHFTFLSILPRDSDLCLYFCALCNEALLAVVSATANCEDTRHVKESLAVSFNKASVFIARLAESCSLVSVQTTSTPALESELNGFFDRLSLVNKTLMRNIEIYLSDKSENPSTHRQVFRTIQEIHLLISDLHAVVQRELQRLRHSGFLGFFLHTLEHSGRLLDRLSAREIATRMEEIRAIAATLQDRRFERCRSALAAVAQAGSSTVNLSHFSLFSSSTGINALGSTSHLGSSLVLSSLAAMEPAGSGAGMAQMAPIRPLEKVTTIPEEEEEEEEDDGVADEEDEEEHLASTAPESDSAPGSPYMLAGSGHLAAMSRGVPGSPSVAISSMAEEDGEEDDIRASLLVQSHAPAAASALPPSLRVKTSLDPLAVAAAAGNTSNPSSPAMRPPNRFPGEDDSPSGDSFSATDYDSQLSTPMLGVPEHLPLAPHRSMSNHSLKDTAGLVPLVASSNSAEHLRASSPAPLSPGSVSHSQRVPRSSLSGSVSPSPSSGGLVLQSSSSAARLDDSRGGALTPGGASPGSSSSQLLASVRLASSGSEQSLSIGGAPETAVGSQLKRRRSRVYVLGRASARPDLGPSPAPIITIPHSGGDGAPLSAADLPPKVSSPTSITRSITSPSSPITPLVSGQLMGSHSTEALPGALGGVPGSPRTPSVPTSGLSARSTPSLPLRSPSRHSLDSDLDLLDGFGGTAGIPGSGLISTASSTTNLAGTSAEYATLMSADIERALGQGALLSSGGCVGSAATSAINTGVTAPSSDIILERGDLEFMNVVASFQQQSQEGTTMPPERWYLPGLGPNNIWNETDSVQIFHPTTDEWAVHSAKFNSLVIFLTSPYHLTYASSQNFLNVFLLTLQLFSSPSLFLEKLVERFNVPPCPSHINPVLYQIQVVDPVQTLVCNILERWIAEGLQFDIIPLPEIIDDVRRFIAQEIHSFEPDRAKRISSSLQKMEDNYAHGLAQLDSLKLCYPELRPTSPFCSTSFVMKTGPRSLAHHLTAIDADLFRAIRLAEFTAITDKQSSPNLQRLITHTNQLTNWVMRCILRVDLVEIRRKMILCFFEVLQELYLLKNFNSLFAIHCALSHTSISRLAQTFRGLRTRHMAPYRRISEVFAMDSNYRNYRPMLASVLSQPDHCRPPVIPVIPILMSDLTFMLEGNQTLTTKRRINWQKCTLLGNVLLDISRAQAASISYRNMLSLNLPRILWEHIHGSSSSDAELYQMSYALEPPDNGSHSRQSSSSGSGIRTSPSLSSLTMGATFNLGEGSRLSFAGSGFGSNGGSVAQRGGSGSHGTGGAGGNSSGSTSRLGFLTYRRRPRASVDGLFEGGGSSSAGASPVPPSPTVSGTGPHTPDHGASDMVNGSSASENKLRRALSHLNGRSPGSGPRGPTHPPPPVAVHARRVSEPVSSRPRSVFMMGGSSSSGPNAAPTATGRTGSFGSSSSSSSSGAGAGIGGGSTLRRVSEPSPRPASVMLASDHNGGVYSSPVADPFGSPAMPVGGSAAGSLSDLGSFDRTSVFFGGSGSGSDPFLATDDSSVFYSTPSGGMPPPASSGTSRLMGPAGTSSSFRSDSPPMVITSSPSNLSLASAAGTAPALSRTKSDHQRRSLSGAASTGDLPHMASETLPRSRTSGVSLRSSGASSVSVNQPPPPTATHGGGAPGPQLRTGTNSMYSSHSSLHSQRSTATTASDRPSSPSSSMGTMLNALGSLFGFGRRDQ